MLDGRGRMGWSESHKKPLTESAGYFVTQIVDLSALPDVRRSSLPLYLLDTAIEDFEGRSTRSLHGITAKQTRAWQDLTKRNRDAYKRLHIHHEICEKDLNALEKKKLN